MMTVKTSLCRKVGLENYSSVGASCELTVELDSALLSDGPGLRERIAAAYLVVSDAVDAELARQTGQQPAAAPEPARNGHATNGAPPRRPQVATPRTVPGQHRNGGAFRHVQGGPPRSGRELFAWAKREQENGSKGLIDWLADFGRSQGYPDKITTWDSVQTAEALAEVMQGAN